MQQSNELVGNCPSCHKVVFRQGDFKSEARYATKCPNCHKPLKVEVKLVTKQEVVVSLLLLFLVLVNTDFFLSFLDILDIFN